ncbi:MAG: alanine racemase [Deltaproteobacteria bacterium CG11_big_fil_rev_8_21_14_0_20_47_16]|nr:MAG: alanine racemase [Deltaproteobacteria bacterium CG11_big_fil_rev_8_21_14_0_20_47_16]
MSPISESPTTSTEIFRPTIATVERAALLHNLNVIQRELPKGAEILAMVKADAYGHGAVHVAQWLSDAGVTAFGVATIEEGVALVMAGIKKPIVVMGGLQGASDRAAKACIQFGLIPVIHSTQAIECLAKVAGPQSVTAHLKIDTGMGRLGIRPESLSALLRVWKQHANLKLGGVMTHFANAGDPKVLTEQLHVWNKCVREVRSELGTIPCIHVANSAAILRHVVPEIEAGETILVRPGIALYGSSSYSDDLKTHPLQVVMSVKSRIVLVKHVPKGTPISYMGAYQLPEEGRVAVVPIGYADGYPWAAQGNAQVLVKGCRVKVAGRITMDMLMLDVSDYPDVQVGDEVTLIGSQGTETITSDDVAGWASTISYEIMCHVGPRVPRVYVE